MSEDEKQTVLVKMNKLVNLVASNSGATQSKAKHKQERRAVASLLYELFAAKPSEREIDSVLTI